MDLEPLFASLKTRTSPAGVVTADRYFRDVEGCFDGGHCPIELTDSEEKWRTALKNAESTLTYRDRSMRVCKGSVTKEVEDGAGILQFDAIITTRRRDRAGDILETKGAVVDPDMPLLWQHVPMQPIGRMLKVLKHSDDLLKARFVIANTALGRDAVELLKIKALRISHGFMPIEFKALEDADEGYHFTKFSIHETSVVSVPCNVDAVITAVNKGRIGTSLMRSWAKSLKPKGCTCKVAVPALPESMESATKASDVLVSSAVGDGISGTATGVISGNTADFKLSVQRQGAVEKLLGVADERPRTFEDMECEFRIELPMASIEKQRELRSWVNLIVASAEEKHEARERDQVLAPYLN